MTDYVICLNVFFPKTYILWYVEEGWIRRCTQRWLGRLQWGLRNKDDAKVNSRLSKKVSYAIMNDEGERAHQSCKWHHQLRYQPLNAFQ